MARAQATTNHEKIKDWVEERGGCPSHVKGTAANGDPGIIRIDFPGYSGQKTLEKISWNKFFKAFDENKLAFLYQEADGSRFNKLVSRKNADLPGPGGRKKAQKKASASKKRANAIDLLKSQHREVEDLFAKIQAARSASPKKKYFEKLADRLAAHAKIEETLFYPAVFTERTEEELREAVEEHLNVKRMIADLMKMKPTDPQFDSKIAVLEEMVGHHVKEEEKELFKAVKREKVEDLEALGEKMKKRYRELLKATPRRAVPKETDSAALCF